MRKSPFELKAHQQRDRVYLLAELEKSSPTGLYKIGKTRSTTASRKRQYQAGNPRRVVIFHEVFVLPGSAQAIETALQQQWALYHENDGGGDEWYRFPQEVLPEVIVSFDQYHIDISTQSASEPNTVKTLLTRSIPLRQPAFSVTQNHSQTERSIELIQPVPPSLATLPIYQLSIPAIHWRLQRSPTTILTIVLVSSAILIFVFVLNFI